MKRLLAAIAPVGVDGSSITSPLTTGSGGANAEQNFVAGLFDKILSVALELAGILAVLFIVYNGIRYITAAGDAAKMKTARGNIANIFIGVIIIVLAYSIINFAQLAGALLNKF